MTDRRPTWRRIGLAAVVAVLAAGCGSGTAPRSDPPAPGRAATTRPAATTSAAGWRRVALDGVYVDVPGSWPTTAPNRMDACTEPEFPAPDRVYVGEPTATTLSISCGGTVEIKHGDGLQAVWLQPGDQLGGPTKTATTNAGVIVRVADSRLIRSEPVLDVYYRGVTVAIGIGADRSVAHTIFESINYAPRAGSSPVAGACPTWVHDSRPTPAHVTHKLVLSAGEVILEPPPAGDRPELSAEAVWQQSRPRIDGEGDTYHLLLARYSAHAEKGPGRVAQDEHPSSAGVLAWVVYQVPTTVAGSCGIYSLEIYNATTGRSLLDAGYSPGP